MKSHLLRYLGLLRAGAMAGLLCLLSSCGLLTPTASAPPPKEIPQIEIAIEASPGLNPDDKGRPSPILLRVYELRGESVFQEADFFSLQNSDKTTLAADMLTVDQFVLRPSDVRSIRRSLHPQTTAIGVFAGYRDLPNASWRAVLKLPIARDVTWYQFMRTTTKLQLRVDLQPNSISLIDTSIGANIVPQGQHETVPNQPASVESEPASPVSGVRGAVNKTVDEAQAKAGDAAKNAAGKQLEKIPNPLGLFK